MGVTCICLALSNFICSKLGRKTAYIELNTTNQIYSLFHGRNKKTFSYFGIDFFPCVTVTSLSEILNKNYDFFILDMGVLNVYTAREFSKCDKQFLVCSLSKWKKHQTMEKLNQLFQQTNLNQRRVTILDNLHSKKSTSFSMLDNRITIPFIPNPFQIETNLFCVFHRILERKN